ncbi:hypothetical protein BDD12DRAFT_803464 [Trichophaea hybrida]|nr:hypothetical protein BDD12DRAFT_803464 [Trichophaea hybrida]
MVSSMMKITHIYSYSLSTGVNITEKLGKDDIVIFLTNFNGDYDVASSQNFNPLPAIRPRGLYNDADLNLVFIRGGIISTLEPSSDPVFAFVHKKPLGLQPEGVYRMVRPQNTIACIETVRFCVNSTGRCTQWLNLLSALSPPRIMDLSEGFQKDQVTELTVTGILISQLLPSTSVDKAILNRGASALQASKSLEPDGSQFNLDPEQWKLELNHWFSLGLAKFQLGLFTTIQAQPDLDVNVLENDFEEFPDLKYICGRVKFRSAQPR